MDIDDEQLENEDYTLGLDFGEPENDVEPLVMGEHYWLQYPPYSQEFGEAVLERFEDHIDHWNGSSYAQCVLAAYRAYHSLAGSSDQPQISLVEGGEQGELLSMSINNFRSTLKHQIAMVTADRPAWEPQARTADADAQKQVPMTSNLLDFVLREGLIKQLSDQFECSKPAGAAFMVLGWDSSAGLLKKGWFTSRVVTPWEMAHESVRDYDNDCSWWIYRAFDSRWNWVAKLAETDPDKARQVLALDQSTEPFGIAPIDGQGGELVKEGGDQIAVLYVIAKPTIACPTGRLAVVTSDGLVLEDNPLPYGDTVPVTRLCSAEFVGTSIPFADAWITLAPCEAISGIISAMMTRIDMFAVPNVTAPTGTEFLPSDLGGANLIESLPGAQQPQLLDLLRIPPEMEKMLATLHKEVEQLSGINSVTRGQPTENITSGSMAALMQSMAIQYNSTDERAWVLNLERVGTILVKIFQAMASEDVLVSICGQDKVYTASQFKKDDINGILRVGIKVASAMSKSPAGKMQIADTLANNKMLQTPAEYMQVLQTGQLESTFAGPTSYLTLIKSENEKLGRGEPPVVSIWDNDQLHIREHMVELNNDARYDEQRAQLINKHIQEHFDSWANKSRQAPDMCAAIGYPPLPQAEQIGQQAQDMQAQAMGAPPPPPKSAGPAPTQQPNTEPSKAAPGPKPAPPGPQNSQAAPKQPEPAKTPGGESVVAA